MQLVRIIDVSRLITCFKSHSSREKDSQFAGLFLLKKICLGVKMGVKRHFHRKKPTIRTTVGMKKAPNLGLFYLVGMEGLEPPTSSM